MLNPESSASSSQTSQNNPEVKKETSQAETKPTSLLTTTAQSTVTVPPTIHSFTRTADGKIILTGTKPGVLPNPNVKSIIGEYES